MKIKILSLILIILGFGFHQATAQTVQYDNVHYGDNVILNHNFANDFVHWELVGAEAEDRFELFPSEHDNGQTLTYDGGNLIQIFSEPVEAEPGLSYLFRVHTRTSGSHGGGANMKLIFMDENDRVGEDWIFLPEDTQEFVYSELTMESPEGTTHLQVELATWHDNHTVEVDAVYVMHEVEEDEAEIAPFALLNPVNGAELLVAGQPADEVEINWETAVSDDAVTYTWHLDVRGGDFSNPIVSLPADNDGQDTRITLTLETIDQLLDDNGLSVGDVLEADWTVTAETDTEVVFADDPFSIDLERGVVEVLQIDSFVLQSPPDGTNLLVEGDFNDPVVITWERPAPYDEDLVFTWHLDQRGGDFSDPIVSLPADNNGNANEITLTLGAIDELLEANNLVVGDILEADWTVTAEFEDLVQFADEPFAIDLERGIIDIGIVPPPDDERMSLQPFPFAFNMDTDVVDWTLPTFWPFDGATLTRIENPDPSGLNESDFVLRYEKMEGAEPWAGFFYRLENPVQLTDNSVFRMKIWSPRSDIQAIMKLELVSGGSTDDQLADVTQSGEWIELEWDLSELDREVSWDMVTVILDMDFDNHPQGGDLHTWYLDDFALEGVGIAPRRYESISDLLENAELGEKSMLSNEVIVTFVAPNFRNQHYLSDETGAVLVDDTGEILSGLERGDGVTGFLFEYSEFRDVAQLLPLEDIDPSSSDNDLPYWESTLADLEYVGEPRLVRVQYVDFLDEGTFEQSTNYGIIDPTVDDPVTFRTHLGDSDVIGQPIPEGTRHVTGIVAEFEGNPQIYAAHYDLLEEIIRYEVVFNADMSQAADFDPDTYDVYIGGNLAGGWAQPGSDPQFRMEPVEDGSDIYTITLHLEEGNYDYKYFLIEDEPDWDMGEWPGDPNRTVTVTDDMEVNDIFGVQPDNIVARAQIIHNAADPAAASVDIYVNSELFVDELGFREATPFVDVPANTALDIAIYPAGADAGEADPVFSIEGVEFAFGETYSVIANGVLGDGFAANPDNVATDFNLFIIEDAPVSANEDEVNFFIWHGATDAPAVDVWVGDGPTLVEGAAYTGFTDVITVEAAEYPLYLGVEGSAGTGDALFEFAADLSGAAGSGAAILASGFLAPEDNQNGAEFGLLVALPDGTTMLLDALEPTSSEQFADQPETFRLEQNYPNPFNPTTNIEFSIPESSDVTLEVFNVQGQRVATLVNENRSAGVHTVEFDASNLSSGVYLYRIRAGGFNQVNKMMLVK